ncbi:MAG TPA: amidohydrolase family protein [Vicinamibacterales bacterium]|nr:amidohydrolase family protein [Vicinamibacterales bacterium]
MIGYRAAWVLPITRPPIRGGVVSIERDRIAAVAEHAGEPVEDLGNVAILPGLVNAHTHLELSWMHGQIARGPSMPGWAASLMSLRRSVSHEPAEPITDAIVAACASGTCLVGDVTNTFAAYEPLMDSELSAAIFRELLGFSAPDPDAVVSAVAARIADLMPIAWLRPSIVPHAPYSVSPALLQAIARHSRGQPLSIHLGESAQEIEFLRGATGEWRDLLESLGVWNAAWVPPACGPVEYLDRLGLVDRHLIAVHGVHFDATDLSRLAAAESTIVTCPRSNRWTGAGVPPIDAFYASGVRVAVGTDSLASVEDLNVFAELAEVRRLAPSVHAAKILESATLAGAQALGFGGELGALEPGKRAQLLAVRLPADVADVEEYLLSGIEPRDVTWLDT